MVSTLLERKSPGEFASASQVIEYKGKVEDFERLVEVLESELKRFSDEKSTSKLSRKWRQAPVDITMRFGWAESPAGAVALTGHVSARVRAVCQRCLAPFDLDLDTDLKLLLLAAGDKPIESRDYEVWELDDIVVAPAELVEEALIMALPFSPRHTSPDECENWQAGELAAEQADDDKVRPFADLRSLLTPVQDKN